MTPLERLRSAGSIDQSALLPTELPPRAAISIAVLLVVVVAFAAGVAMMVPLPVTAEGPFTLAPASGADPVKAPLRGTVEEVLVSEGTDVSSGDILLTIRSEDLAVLVEREKRLASEIAAQEGIDRALRGRHVADVQAARARVGALTTQVELARENKRLVGRQLEIERSSVEQGLVSESRLLEAERAATVADSELARLEGDLDEANDQIEQLAAAQASDLAEMGLTVARLKGEMAETRAAIAGHREAIQRNVRLAGGVDVGDELNLYAVVAPYDGTVVGMGPRRAGAIIERGEVLCHVARAGAKLRAEITIPELESGRVRDGDPVKLLFDAYPYTRYGTRNAVVTWVSPSAAEGAVRSHATCSEDGIVIDGVTRPFRAGMRGSARIIVDRRTLWQYALEPLRRLREGVSAPAAKTRGRSG